MKLVRTVWLIFLSLCMTLPIMAQQNDHTHLENQKLSGWVREICQQQQHSSYRIAGRKTKVSLLTAFIKTSEPTSTLSKQGCQVYARWNDIVIASIPVGKIRQLASSPSVLRIEAGPSARLCLDTTAVIVQATPVWQGDDLPQGYDGSGVVVGVVDIGFDLTHPTFYSSDMSKYRILSIWDQLSTDTLGSTLPVGRDYQGREALLKLGCPRDGYVQTHGTHTASTAAGSGTEGVGTTALYKGMAPGSDLCLVVNGTSDDYSAGIIDSLDAYKYTTAMDALAFKYIFDQAKQLGRPCVINFSEGSRADFSGDDILYGEVLSRLTGPGRILVASAGNEGGRHEYLLKERGTERDGAAFYPFDDGRMFFTKSKGDYTTRIRFFAGSQQVGVYETNIRSIAAAKDSTLTDTIKAGTHNIICEATLYPSCYHAEDLICDWILKGYSKSGLTAVVDIIGKDADVEMYADNSLFATTTLDSSLSGGECSHQVLMPAACPSVIAVGASAWRTLFPNSDGETTVFDHGTHGQKANFSSVGPALNDSIKPDILAPGANIIAAYSSYYLSQGKLTTGETKSGIRYFEENGRRYAWFANSGTSMSAPVVTGIIALWLQADPTLTPQDCREIFARTARRYQSDIDYPNNSYGYGEIDAAAGMKLVLEKVAAGIHEVPLPVNTDQRWFLPDGRQVKKPLHGLFISHGKAVIVR